MINYQDKLRMAQKGGGLLFCGAGFSADCLSFDPDMTLGTGAQLTQIFNEKLAECGKPSFRKLQNAASALEEEIGQHGMMNLLTDRFRVSSVSEDLVDIIRYPWEVIYTTNYDDALEIAAQNAGRNVTALSNTDDPATTPSGTPIAHLHGYIHKWDILNFSESCVLGAESYFRLTKVRAWLDRFRSDVDRAQFVAFIGFNAADFHINQVVFDLVGLQEKAIFVNRPTPEIDRDVEADQKRLGTPLYFGRNGFAKQLTAIQAEGIPDEPRLASFRKFHSPIPATSVPRVDDIESLFVFGETVEEQIARDLLNDTSDYHITREATNEIVQAIREGVSILLITGYICDGKSLYLNDLSIKLASTRPVYHLKHPYESLLNETAEILKYATNAVLVVENCFDLREDRLLALAKQFEGEDRVLLLSSRSVAADAEVAGLTGLKNLSTFRVFPIPPLTDSEIDSLDNLVDQFAGWRGYTATTRAARYNYLVRTCQRSLPHFLLRLLNSKHVRDRYREELNKIPLSSAERDAIIAALYTAHVSHDAPIAFLSNALHTDVGGFLDRFNNGSESSQFRIVRRRGDTARTVPSIGATNILKHFMDDVDIVNAVVAVLKSLAENTRRDDFEQHMFNQMMRYSILQSVVTSRNEQDRFFDNISREPYFRRMPLFWLQWHMAKTDMGDFLQAEKYLEQGYRETREFERRKRSKYDLKQLDDRRAKFLMTRVRQTSRSRSDLFRDFKESCELTNRILGKSDPQHYPFETLEQIAISFGERGSALDEGQREVVNGWISAVRHRARQKLDRVPEGYQLDTATNALKRVDAEIPD